MSDMRGVILFPPKFRNHILKDTYRPFIDALIERYGFELLYEENYSPPSYLKVVITIKGPQHTSNPIPLVNLDSVRAGQVLIGRFCDIHGEMIKPVLERLFDRYDFILSNSYEFFSYLFPGFLHKCTLFPNFTSDYPQYMSWPLNDAPIGKCLLSGANFPDVYPLRHHVSQLDSPFVDVLPHPGYHKTQEEYNQIGFVGERYAIRLWSYSCCISTSSFFRYLLAKCFEIPATGALLLVNRFPDLDMAGMEAGKHYVEINQNNVKEVIEDCVKNIGKYRQIREDGMRFVRKNHSFQNRVETVCQILDSL